MDTDLVFDTTSGISEEEQREILARIDTIAGKNRIAPTPEFVKTAAKKRGFLFPLLVNLGALMVLAGGFLLLFNGHGKDEADIREEAAILGITERKLIQEIRKETTLQISEQERQIADILAKLAGVDAELRNLQVSMDKRLAEKEAELRHDMDRELREEQTRLNMENLSEAVIAERMRTFDEERIVRLNAELATFRQQLDAEKRISEAQLQKLHDEYQNQLALVHRERAQILETSRIREANLYAQFQEKNNELTSLYEQSRNDLTATQEELQQLTDEGERSALIEGQLGGYYTMVNDYIRQDRLPEATETLAAMREFLDTPSFQNIRAIQSRKELYLATINALSGMIEDRLQAASPGVSPIEVPQIEASSGIAPSGDEAASLMASASYEATIAELQKQTEALTAALTERDKTIAAIQTQGSSQGRAAANYENTISSLRKENTTLEKTVASRDSTISELRTQTTSLQQTVATRESTIGELRTQNTSLQQTVSARESTISELQTQNTTLQQTTEQLRQTNDAVRQLLGNQ
ncbi:MAG: hypothetical protein LBT14_10875 [Treponema sp.]|jgi:chromosome segregation ATPase|nr:hypothetical protein [Treponema sp.]